MTGRRSNLGEQQVRTLKGPFLLGPDGQGSVQYSLREA